MRPGYFAPLLASMLILAASASSAGAFKVIKEGSETPAFTITGQDGSRYDLAWVQQGKGTLVVFWANWSPRSKEALEGYAGLYRAYQDKGFRILAVNVEGERVDAARQGEIDAYLRATPLPFPVAMDHGLQVYQVFGVMVVPSMALIDPAGKVVFETSGYTRETYGETEEKVKALLGIATPTPTPAVVWAGGHQPDPKALRKYGMAARLVEMGMADQAVTSLKEAAELDPGYADPWFLLARIQYSAGNADQAVELLRKGLAIDPNSAAGHLELAKMLMAGGDAKGAAAEAAKVPESAKNDPKVLVMEGSIHETAGDLKKAAEAYRKALSILLTK